MRVMFLDESGDHSLEKIDEQFPVFCLAGCIFDEVEYQQNCIANINAFKLRYFNNTDIILHSREIRKCEPPFNVLLNKETKVSFYKDLDALTSSLPYTIIASAILKSKLKDKYIDPANPYILSLEFMMERFLFFLEEKNESGYISVESRDPKSNTDLLTAFTNIINNGTWINDAKQIEADRFRSRIGKMIFVTKKENENGHQLADLIAYPVARFALNQEAVNPAFDVIKSKFRTNDTSQIMGYGLKIFPNK